MRMFLFEIAMIKHFFTIKSISLSDHSLRDRFKYYSDAAFLGIERLARLNITGCLPYFVLVEWLPILSSPHPQTLPCPIC